VDRRRAIAEVLADVNACISECQKNNLQGLLAELAGCMLRIEGLKKKDNGFARNNTRSRW